MNIEIKNMIKKLQLGINELQMIKKNIPKICILWNFKVNLRIKKVKSLINSYKKESIFDELYKFINNISCEIRKDDCDKLAIDFWLFKINRRIKELRII